jgi:DNA-binding NtrC family response regulator
VFHFDRFIQSPRAVPDTASPLLAGNSLSAQSLRQLVALAASSSDPVLLTGPVGAGKRTIAKVIHAHSPRATFPFVEASASSFSTDQLAARWEGSYYLNDVQQLPVPAQHRLLTWLDTTQAQTVKLIASTDGRDDGDRIIAPLRIRLHRLRVPCPALVQRRGDVAVILQRLWAEDRDHVPPILDHDGWAVLLNDPWVGNYRALRDFAGKTIRLFGGRKVTAEQARRILGGKTEQQLNCANFDLKQHLAREEKLFLIEALLRSNGVVAAAAGLAGLQRTTFIAKMKRHGLARI